MQREGDRERETRRKTERDTDRDRETETFVDTSSSHTRERERERDVGHLQHVYPHDTPNVRVAEGAASELRSETVAGPHGGNA